MDLALESARITRQMWENIRLWIRVFTFMVVREDEQVVEDDDEDEDEVEDEVDDDGALG